MNGNRQRLSRAWDEFDGYLFDIDGTLLNCQDAVHYFAFCDALSVVAGRPVNLDGVVTHGNTDEGILRDAFGLAGVAESVWRARLPEIRERIGGWVERDAGQLRIEVLPGVREILAHLRGRGALLSTATGNLARVGEVKLRACGLREFFALGGWSDGCETRTEVFGRALAAMRGEVGAAAAICVVGDTPADVQAAHAHGLDVIAVATGIFPRAELVLERPEACVDDLLQLCPEPESAAHRHGTRVTSHPHRRDLVQKIQKADTFCMGVEALMVERVLVLGVGGLALCGALAWLLDRVGTALFRDHPAVERP